MELVLKVSEPLVKVIHLVDSDDRLAMGYLHGVIDRAKETIEANIKKKSIAFHVGGLLIKNKNKNGTTKCIAPYTLQDT